MILDPSQNIYICITTNNNIIIVNINYGEVFATEDFPMIIMHTMYMCTAS